MLVLASSFLFLGSSFMCVSLGLFLGNVEPGTWIPIGAGGLVTVIVTLGKGVFWAGGKLKSIEDSIRSLDQQHMEIKRMIYSMPCQGCPTDKIVLKPYSLNLKGDTDFLNKEKKG